VTSAFSEDDLGGDRVGCLAPMLALLARFPATEPTVGGDSEKVVVACSDRYNFFNVVRFICEVEYSRGGSRQ
jgi:hypothetical protein